MSLRELEEEIIEIEKVRERCKPGSIEWSNIDSIITDKKRQISRLKTQGDVEEDDILGEEDNVLGSCGGDCGSCGGGR